MFLPSVEQERHSPLFHFLLDNLSVSLLHFQKLQLQYMIQGR